MLCPHFYLKNNPETKIMIVTAALRPLQRWHSSRANKTPDRFLFPFHDALKHVRNLS